MRMIRVHFHIALLTFSGFLSSCTVQQPRINGVSFVASPEKVDSTHVLPVRAINANYASIMPFGFIRNTADPEVYFNSERQWFGETLEGVRQYTDVLQQQKVQIMIKPQIWIWRGEYTGTLEMTSEADWMRLEASYQDFIMSYARLAQILEVPVFCIGTELDRFVQARPEYWNGLIDSIRTIYDGSLTYAANWDEYKRVPFWDRLDYIGVDAYFPITDQSTPDLDAALMGWQPWLLELESVSTTHDRPILFTEYGYRSLDYAGKEPWQSTVLETGANLEAQTILLQALYESVWDQSWFAGGFIWKWFVNHQTSGGNDNNMFTPQNKPAQALIREQYGSYKED